MSCKSFHNDNSFFLLVEVYYDGGDKTKVEMLGFLSNDSAESAKL